MKTLLKISSVILILFSFGCKNDDQNESIEPETVLTFDVEQSNSSNDFTSSVKSISLRHKNQDWSELSYESKKEIRLTRSIHFDVMLENGQEFDLGFWFIKYETDKAQLILEKDTSNQLNEEWDYVSTEVEASNFYKGFYEACVLMNNHSNSIYHNEENESFEVEVEKVMIDGEEKSYVTINFEGIAYGVYDQEGKYQEYFTLKNGVFKGVIE